MIINVRGTNGSGKTTTVTEVVDPSDMNVASVVLGEYLTKAGKPRPISGYRTKDGIVLLGRYSTACGGCDGLPDVRTCYRAAVEAALLPGVRCVLLEGLMISGVYQSVRDELSREYQRRSGGGLFVWAFMDTPIDLCVQRTRERTKKPPDWNPVNVTKKHSAVVRTRERAVEDGEFVLSVPSPGGGAFLRQFIEGARL